MEKILQVVVFTLTLIGACTIGVWLLDKGMSKQEIVDCNLWVAQSQEFRSFFITKWQDDQCRAHGIIIDAPVHSNQ